MHLTINKNIYIGIIGSMFPFQLTIFISRYIRYTIWWCQKLAYFDVWAEGNVNKLPMQMSGGFFWSMQNDNIRQTNYSFIVRLFFPDGRNALSSFHAHFWHIWWPWREYIYVLYDTMELWLIGRLVLIYFLVISNKNDVLLLLQ